MSGQLAAKISNLKETLDETVITAQKFQDSFQPQMFCGRGWVKWLVSTNESNEHVLEMSSLQCFYAVEVSWFLPPKSVASGCVYRRSTSLEDGDCHGL